MNIIPQGIMIDWSIGGYITKATITTRRNMIHEARSVATTNEFLCSGCSVLFRVIAIVVAVDDMSHPIPPEAIIPMILDNTYPAYSTPAITTTKNHILYGLKNASRRTGCCQ